MTPKEDDGRPFLSRWSKRKLQEAPAEVPSEPVETSAEPPAADAPSDAELLEQHGLPDPDSLQPGDDFAAFMKSGIPDRLRRKALRRLWLSNPVLANLDELVDYGGDFTDAATVVENMQTVYEVGKGAAARVRAELDAAAAERAALAEQAALEAGPEPELEPDLRNARLTEERLAEEEDGAPEDEMPEAPEVSPTGETEIAAIPRPRPMRFEFE